MQEQMYFRYFQHSGGVVQYSLCRVRICVHAVLKVDGGCQVVMGIYGKLPHDNMQREKTCLNQFLLLGLMGEAEMLDFFLSMN